MLQWATEKGFQIYLIIQHTESNALWIFFIGFVIKETVEISSINLHIHCARSMFSVLYIEGYLNTLCQLSI